MHPPSMGMALLAGATLSSVALIAMRQEAAALTSLAQAERDFSARCAQVGFRQSFLDHFDDAGVFFNPAPSLATMDLRKRPEEKPPFAFSLEWAPQTGDVSSAGDLGYTTGPFKSASAGQRDKPGWGHYFSVWRRTDPSSPWKVVLDFGVRSAEPQTDPPRVLFTPTQDHKASFVREEAPFGELVEAEKNYALRASKANADEAISGLAATSVRVHRDGPAPAVGLPAAKALLASEGKATEWVVTGGGISRSGDMGYTYGRYTRETASGESKGYFARVWKRQADGAWKIVADIANKIAK